MPQAYIGLGSNLGRARNGVYEDSKTQLHQALKAIAQHPEIQLLKVSSFFQTKAMGPGKQPDYINAAAKIKTTVPAYELLHFFQSIENQQGRTRTLRWGARILDLDILLYDQMIEDTERLTIPHPHLHQRAFVLAPLVDLDPELTIPNGENISDLLAKCPMQGIVKLPD